MTPSPWCEASRPLAVPSASCGKLDANLPTNLAIFLPLLNKIMGTVEGKVNRDSKEGDQNGYMRYKLDIGVVVQGEGGKGDKVEEARVINGILGGILEGIEEPGGGVDGYLRGARGSRLGAEVEEEDVFGDNESEDEDEDED
ncbi:hypothetical protein TrRE_jg3918, partial [Triparma retinervis]